MSVDFSFVAATAITPPIAAAITRPLESSLTCGSCKITGRQSSLSSITLSASFFWSSERTLAPTAPVAPAAAAPRNFKSPFFSVSGSDEGTGPGWECSLEASTNFLDVVFWDTAVVGTTSSTLLLSIRTSLTLEVELIGDAFVMILDPDSSPCSVTFTGPAVKVPAMTSLSFAVFNTLLVCGLGDCRKSIKSSNPSSSEVYQQILRVSE